MKAQPDRTLATFLLHAGVVSGMLAFTGVLLLFDGVVPTLDGMRSMQCLVWPACFIDWALHSTGVLVWTLVSFALLAVLRAVRRTCAFHANLLTATLHAKLDRHPSRIGLVAAICGVESRLDVVDLSNPLAFAYGLRNPRICISTGLADRLTARELEAVLRHEDWHCLRRDPARLMVVYAVSAAMGPIRAFRRLERQFRIATEIRADAHAVRSMGHRQWLASALSKLADHRDGARPAAATGFLGYANDRVAVLAGDAIAPSPGMRSLALIEMTQLALVAMLVVWSHNIC